jgi:hypothetical protein
MVRAVLVSSAEGRFAYAYAAGGSIVATTCQSLLARRVQFPTFGHLQSVVGAVVCSQDGARRSAVMVSFRELWRGRSFRSDDATPPLTARPAP